MANKLLLIATFILLVVIGGYFILRNRDNSTTQLSYNQSPRPQQTILDVQNPTSQLSTFTPNPNETILNTINTRANGTVRGQIVCDYIIPAAPDNHGTANIESNWNNTQISVCLSVNGGGNTLISNDQNINSSRTDKADFISLNTSYQFNLFDGLNCTGNILSSCQINQSAPTKAPFSH